MAKSNIPDLQTLIQAGFDPKTKLPKKIGTKPCIKEDVKKMLRIVDEQDAVNRGV